MAKLDTCPECGKQIECNSNLIGQGSPNPGDIALCGYCGACLVFDHDLSRRQAIESDLSSLTPPELIAVRHAQRVIRRIRHSRN